MRFSFILTCNTSSLPIADAMDIAKSAILNSSTGKPYRKDGIGYAFAQVGDNLMLVISLLDK